VASGKNPCTPNVHERKPSPSVQRPFPRFPTSPADPSRRFGLKLDQGSWRAMRIEHFSMKPRRPSAMSTWCATTIQRTDAHPGRARSGSGGTSTSRARCPEGTPAAVLRMASRMSTQSTMTYAPRSATRGETASCAAQANPADNGSARKDTASMPLPICLAGVRT